MPTSAKLGLTAWLALGSASALGACASGSAAPPIAPATTATTVGASSTPNAPNANGPAPKPLASAPPCAAASSKNCTDSKPPLGAAAQPAHPARESSAAPPLPTAKPAQGGLARGSVEPVDLELAAGDQAYQNDDLAGAKAHYEKARKLSPKDPAPQIGLVRVALAESDVATDYAAAPKNPALLALLRKVDAALKLDEAYAPAYVERGRLLLILGNAPEALSALDRAQRLAPEDAETQSALGVALLATGKPAEALTRLRRAAELDPDNAERLTNLGTAFLIQGEVAAAVRAFTRAAVLAPDDAKVH